VLPHGARRDKRTIPSNHHHPIACGTICVHAGLATETGTVRPDTAMGADSHDGVTHAGKAIDRTGPKWVIAFDRNG